MRIFARIVLKIQEVFQQSFYFSQSVVVLGLFWIVLLLISQVTHAPEENFGIVNI